MLQKASKTQVRSSLPTTKKLKTKYANHAKYPYFMHYYTVLLCILRYFLIIFLFFMNLFADFKNLFISLQWKFKNIAKIQRL